MNRIRSIDITRGLVMVIMALDHVREFWHTTAMTVSPTDLTKTTTALFFTRWITHLCAPAFVFLAGASAYISIRRTGNISESRKFLLTRGLWLVLLEFTLINFALWFDIRFRLLILEVIGAIGFSFIILSLLLSLGSRTVGTLGLIIILSHNMLQVGEMPVSKASALLFSALFRPNMIQFSDVFSIFTAYPVIPWLGIMLLGFGFGEVFELTFEKRKKFLLWSGTSALFLFVVLRFTNIYGDPAIWSDQKSCWFTFLSFINVTKYPPSLLFTLLFVGLTLITLRISEGLQGKFSSLSEAYGKVPFFYFVVHLYLIHALMFVMLFIQGYGKNDMVFGAFKNGRPDTGGGISLTGVYLIWLGVVIVMYPLCRWYGRFKAEKRHIRILRYL
ncbi:MAG: DUF1624 domain-containing protein [Chloroflexota bacterium]